MSWVISILYIRHRDAITTAEEVSGDFHKLEIRKALLDALEALKQSPDRLFRTRAVACHGHPLKEAQP